MHSAHVALILILLLNFDYVKPAQPLNFVILFADDLGYGDLGYTGHPTISTPNIDFLAQSGMKFTQAYSAFPMCSPSRSALLTGRLPIRTGVNDVLPCDAVGGLPLNETTLAELLQPAGYATGHIGKWHLGQRPELLPTNHGFDTYLGVPYSVDMGCTPGWEPYPCPENTSTTCATPLPLFNGSTVIQQPANLHTLSVQYAMQAQQFLQEHKNGPFFLYMAFNHVHVARPSAYGPSLQWATDMWYNSSIRGHYGDAVSEMDWVVGQILSEMRSLGLEENTLIFFTSDNGPWLIQNQNGGSAGLFYEGKGSTWEGGIRMPTLAYLPGTIAPSTNRQVISLMDFFPTIAELANVSLPPNVTLDGRSIAPLLFNNSVSPHDFLFFYNAIARNNYTVNAVRYSRWKVHYWTRTNFYTTPAIYHNPPLLYDIEADPSEKYPLDANQYSSVLNTVAIGLAQHRANLIPGINQLALGSNSTLAPCCNRATNCVCNERVAVPSWETSLTSELFRMK